MRFEVRDIRIGRKGTVILLGLLLVIASIYIDSQVMSIMQTYEEAGIDDYDENEVVWESLHTYTDQSIENTRIDVQEVNGIHMLVLPSSVSPEAVRFYFSGDPDVKLQVEGNKASCKVRNGNAVDLTSLCESGDFTLRFGVYDNPEDEMYEVTVMFSENVASVYLCSDDPVEYGREWVEDSGRKRHAATGRIVVQNANGSIVYNGELTQVKGRGNSTWESIKKPYQIKIAPKANLLEAGGTTNIAKTWVLLSNYYDNTALRNVLALNIGRALGMESNIESRWVDLYYDAEYRGSYLLTEKVEIADGRVDIADLEEVNEEINIFPDPIEIDRDYTQNGATYYYCKDIISPSDISGGYLLELDFAQRAELEASYFVTSRGYHIVVKSPDLATKEEMHHIASLYQEFEDAIYNNGVNPDTGKHFSEYMDMDSMVIHYLINEWTKNRDGLACSTFFYKSEDSDIMTMGPLWDYDLTLGIGGGDTLVGKVSSEDAYIANGALGRAFCNLEDFREATKKMYEEEFRPLIQDVVLGDENAVSPDGYLHSLAYYAKEINATAECNMQRWYPGQSWEDEVEFMKDFIAHRIVYMDKFFSTWIVE